MITGRTITWRTS